MGDAAATSDQEKNHGATDATTKPAANFDPRPIGLFDSGIGGLTVLSEILNHFPQESFIYLGDTARLPYGSKSPATIERYLSQNIQYLIGLNVKAVIVACNSASTVLLHQDPPTKQAKFTIPVYNVIEPGAAAALKSSRGRRIGVLGTKATIAAGAYEKTLRVLDTSVVVYSQACPLLVPLVEEGWEDDPLTNLVIYRYVAPLLEKQIDTLIMGCTHYPALRGGFAKVAGPNVILVDSAHAIATSIEDDISSGRLGRGQDPLPLRVMTTDNSPGYLEVARRLLRPHSIPAIQLVDI